jgi:glyoxylate reductase
MAKIFVTRKIPDTGIKALKAAGHAVAVWPKDAVIPRAELLKRVKGCDAVLSMLTEKVDDAFFDAAGPGLKIVANFAVGYDNFDMAAFKKRGVLAANTPGVLNEAVAEHTFTLLMAIAKRVAESDAFFRAGKYKGWAPQLLLGTQLEGKTLGVIGLGRIGVSVARKASKGFGMNVMYNDVKRNEEFEREFNAGFASIEGILQNADFVSLHVPLLPSTRHLIDAKRLKLMKKTSYLINTARGPVVDEKALVAALKRKQIAGAALDVFENEPKPAPGLTKLANTVLTPHTASATREARDEMATLAASAILDVLAGKEPKNLIK